MAMEFLAELLTLGVTLSIDGDGRLAYDAPAGVIDDDLLSRMRAERHGLLAAITERTGPEYLAPIPGVICPWCRLGEQLLEYAKGLHCDRCDRVVFRFEGDSIIRVDWVDLIEFDWPAIAERIAESEERHANIEQDESLQSDLMFDS